MNPEFAEGVTAWLLTYAVHSTVLLGLVWLIHQVRRLDPGSSDIFWKVALVGGVITASIQTTIDHRPAGTVALVAAPSLITPALLGDVGSALPASSEIQRNRQSGNTPIPAADAPSSFSVPPASLAMVAWFAIAAMLVLAYVGRRLILIGRLGDRRPVTEDNVRRVLAELNENSSRPMSVRLTTSSAISSPVALGRSEICLPTAALVELEPAQQRAMLAHELAHLERSDPMWLAFACLLERAFFFQPLNRLARRRMQESAEYLCDEIAASRSGGVPLARCLVKVAEWIQASPLGVPVAGMAEERSQLAARVVRLLESGKRGVRRSGRTLTVASVVVLMAMVAVVPGVAGRSRPGLPTQPTTHEKSQRVDGNNAAVPPTNPTAPLDATPAMGDDNVGLPLAGKDKDRANQPDAIMVKEDTAVVRALMARLRDEDAGVRAAAANALGRIGDPMAIPALVSSLEDPSKEVRYAAVSALGNFDEGVPAGPLRKLLKSDDVDMRHQVAHMLGNMEDRESAPALALLISDLSVDVRIAAIEALGNLGVTTISDAIRAAMVDVNADVRRAAIEALDNLEIKFNEADILRGLNDPDADVRDAAVEIAGDQRIVAAVPMLIRLLDDTNSEVRQCAAEALAEIRNDAARAALRRALEHRDPEVRRVAVEFFGEDKDR